MKTRSMKQIWRIGLMHFGLIPNEPEIAKRINKQNFYVGYALSFIITIFCLIFGSIHATHYEESPMWGHVLFSYIFSLLGAVGFIVGSFFHRKKQDANREWFYTILILIFVISLLNLGFSLSVESHFEEQGFIPLTIAMLFSFLLLTVKPSIMIVAIGAIMVMIASWAQRHYPDYVIGPYIVLYIVIGLISLLRHAFTFVLMETQADLDAKNAQLAKASATDGLTGLNNRVALRDNFEKYCGQTMIVVLMDLDEFKSINDTYGHDVGDAALVAFSNKLRELFGEEYAFRFGGDEFMVFGPDGDNVRESISKLMEYSYTLPKGEEVHCSVGYATGTPYRDEDVRLIIKLADRALYNAKNTGKHKVVSHN